jgi:hypothetical protein
MPPEAAAAHGHDPQHGGVVLELGEHEGHLEVVHDATAGTLTAWVYDAEMKPVASEAPTINLSKGGVQVPMTSLAGSSGATDAWKASHDALKAAPLEGRVRLQLGGKTFQASLEDVHK